MNAISPQVLECLSQNDGNWVTRLLASLGLAGSLAACGGGGSGLGHSGAGVHSGMPNELPSPNPVAVVLAKPVLSFTDTGLSVSDGVTRIGAWQVSSLVGWEYSFDMGRTWTQGEGDFFDVRGDGAKSIWVRALDDLCNNSEIVMVSCVLDTMPPAPVQAKVANQDLTRLVRVSGIEPQGSWEYSLDDQRTWWLGTGDRLAVLGNALPVSWLRQVDLAGNPSPLERVNLLEPGSPTWHEASGNPMQPSVLSLQLARMVVLHDSVVRGDADYIRWDIPVGQRLQALRLVHYVSLDPIAFYALQRASVFDAGIDVSRMRAYGHMGPSDLQRNVLEKLLPTQLTSGPMTLWFQQTGPQATEYAIELVFQAVE